MAEGLYIEGRKIKNFSDPQRNYQYEIVFTNAASLMGGEWGDDDVTLRARSFTVPQRGNEKIESNFGAMKQFFPGKPTFSESIDIMFEETQSQAVSRFLNAWQEKIFSVTDGHSNYTRKRGNNGGNIATDGICDLVYIKAFAVDGSELDNKYYFVNAWISNVNEVNLDYSQASDAVKYTATLSFDFFTYSKTPPDFSSSGNAENIGVNPGFSDK